jgi:hypothetical protein
MNLRAACILLAAVVGALALLTGCGSSGTPAATSTPAIAGPDPGQGLPPAANLPIKHVVVKKAAGPPLARMHTYFKQVAPWVLHNLSKLNGSLTFLPTNGPTVVFQVNTTLASIAVARQVCRIAAKGIKAEQVPKVGQIQVNGYDPGTPVGYGALATYPPDRTSLVMTLC